MYVVNLLIFWISMHMSFVCSNDSYPLRENFKAVFDNTTRNLILKCPYWIINNPSNLKYGFDI